MNYYYFIAGLPDLQIDSAKNAPPMKELLEEMDETLSESDMKLLKLLRMRYDNRNFLTFLKDRSSRLNPLGNLKAEDWEELINIMENGTEFAEENEPRLEKYIAEFYHRTHDATTTSEIIFKEELLSTLYYDHGMRCKNKFVAQWFEYCLNLNNILTAFTCKKHGIDMKEAIVGNNETAEIIRKNGNSRDLGLKGVFDEFEIIATVAETTNLMERERRIDALRWQWLEDNTLDHYFSAEKALSFWLKCELIHRWDGLTTENGAKIFRDILDELKKGVKFQ
jgi:hypothetical protein